ncbi:hypothetical protein JHK86_016314 [Glycine max]|nr:hypothetical protein JHK86_016314 [Glycine max]
MDEHDHCSTLVLCIAQLPGGAQIFFKSSFLGYFPTCSILVALLTKNALQLLLKTKVDLKAKNLENSTALDVVTSAEIRNALVKAGAKQGSSITNAPTLADKLRWNITLMGKITIFVLRIRSDITEDQRQAFLIVAALIATATYQSALSPPGGVFQANAGNNNNNNVNITSLNSTTIATQGINVGTSVISEVWWTFSIVYKRLKCHEKKRDIGTRNSTGRNIW